MKGFKVLLGVGLVLMFSMVSFAGEPGHSANKPCPIWCDGGSQGVVAVSKASSTTAVGFSANPQRLDGELINLSTNYLRCYLGTGTTTAVLAADYFIIYPAGDTYNRDRFRLKQNDNVYRGALTFYGYSAVSAGTKEEGKISFWEWE